MNVGSPKFTIDRITALSLLLVLFWLAGCSNSTNSPAPVLPINVSNSSGRISCRMIIISPLKLKKMYTNSISSTITRNIQLSTTSVSAAPPPKKGHIIYNRQYNNISKGSCTNSNIYTIKHGDTLFYVAWITGNDFRDLAQRNNIQAPYILNIGQKLQVGNINVVSLTSDNATSATNTIAQSNSAKFTKKTNTVAVSQSKIMCCESLSKQRVDKIFPGNKRFTVAATAPVAAPIISCSTELTNSNSASFSLPISTWRWPTEGKVIENFSSFEGGNKGIDIAGNKGQSIVATADGRVVYTGSALRGYGDLIIIKHNDDYLSAYAHNDTMLVQEQQEVKAGQKIATMGSTGTSSIRLHFEIRYKGKSINPLQCLSQR